MTPHRQFLRAALAHERATDAAIDRMGAEEPQDDADALTVAEVARLNAPDGDPCNFTRLMDGRWAAARYQNATT